MSWFAACGVFAITAIAAPAVAGAAKVSSSDPSNFRNDYDARLAATEDGRDLWLGVVGTNRMGEYRARVWRASGRSWTRLPGSLETPYGDGATYGDGLQLAAFRPAGARAPTVCVGDSPGERGRVRCRTGGAWRELPSSPSATGVLVGLRGETSSMTGLFASWSNGRTTLRVARSTGGPFEAIGPPLELGGLADADLGTTAGGSSDVVDVGIQWTRGPRSGRQTVVTLGSSGWRRLPVQRGRFVPIQLSGPVRDGGATSAPAIEPRPGGRYVRNWGFSVRRWSGKRWSEIGAPRLSRGSGANVGGVYAVGDEAWAAWSGTSMPNLSRGPQRRVTIAPLGDHGKVGPKIQVFRGTDPGPTMLQMVAYRGRPAILTNQAPQGPWRATVSVIRTRGTR